MKKSIVSSSFLQTKNIAKTLAKILLEAQSVKRAQVLALIGELGSGKTAFVQGFAKGLGIKERILSPTFIIMKKFEIGGSRYFYHIDCYRLDSPEKELLRLGFKDIIQNPKNIVAIEWADRVESLLPRNTIWVRFVHAGRGLTQRSIVIS